MSGPSGEHPRELLSAYLDGEVTGAERAAVEAHLAGCSACREHLLSLRALASAVRDQPVPPVPAVLEERIGRRLDAASVVPFRRRFVVPATIAATIAAVGLVSLVVFEQRRPEPAATPRATPEIPRPQILQNENLERESKDKDQKKAEPEKQKLELDASRADAARSLAKEKTAAAPPPAAPRARDELAPSPPPAPSEGVTGGVVGGVAGGVEGYQAEPENAPRRAEEQARAAKSLAAAPTSVVAADCGGAITDAPASGTWLVQDTDDATRRIAALALKLGGRLAPGQPDAPMTLLVEIPAANYPSFVAEARAMDVLGLDDVRTVEAPGCVRQRIVLRRVAVN